MGHMPCTHDGKDMPACTPDLRHAHRLPQEVHVREACRRGGDLHGAFACICLNAHGTWTGAGNEHGIMPRASPFRRMEELSSQKPAKSCHGSGLRRGVGNAGNYVLFFCAMKCLAQVHKF